MFRFNLGDKVRDTFTGFVGFIHGSAAYITGCNQHVVNARTVEGGKPSEGHWLDDMRLELVEAAAPVAAVETGGPTAGEAAGLRNC